MRFGLAWVAALVIIIHSNADPVEAKLFRSRRQVACRSDESKVLMKETVEYRALSLRSVFLHQRRAVSSEAYREAHASLDTSDSFSSSFDVVDLFGGGIDISSAYAEANSLITNRKESREWERTDKQTFQDGYQIFRYSKTQILIDGKYGKTEVLDYVNSGPTAETDAQLRKRAHDYLLNKYNDPGRIRNTTYAIEFCAKRRMPDYRVLRAVCGLYLGLAKCDDVTVLNNLNNIFK